MLKLETRKDFHALSWASRARLRGYVKHLITIKQQIDAERSAREVIRVTTAMCWRSGRQIVCSLVENSRDVAVCEGRASGESTSCKGRVVRRLFISLSNDYDDSFHSRESDLVVLPDVSEFL